MLLDCNAKAPHLAASFVMNKIQWNLSRDLTNAHVRTRNSLTHQPYPMHKLLARHGFSSYKTQYNGTTKIAALYYIQYPQTSWPHHISWRSNSLPGMRLEVHLPVGILGGRGPEKIYSVIIPSKICFPWPDRGELV